jgi:hypothetical protein
MEKGFLNFGDLANFTEGGCMIFKEKNFQDWVEEQGEAQSVQLFIGISPLVAATLSIEELWNGIVNGTVKLEELIAAV